MNANTIQQQLPINTILNGNCIDKMRQMPANSIDLILTDPPYLVNYRDRNGRSIQNDAWLRPAMREAYRVLKPDRVAIMFYGWTRVDAFFAACRLSSSRSPRLSEDLFFQDRLSQLSARAGIPHG